MLAGGCAMIYDAANTTVTTTTTATAKFSTSRG
jgi:hypothetical protein